MILHEVESLKVSE